MKKIALFSIAVLALLAIFVAAKPASADIPAPSVTNFYFQMDGQPYGKPLQFFYDCYGYESWPPDFTVLKPGTYTPEKLTTLPYANAVRPGDQPKYDCGSYGCEVEGNNGPFSWKYQHLDYCIFHIDTEGKTFEVKKTDVENDCEDAKIETGDGFGLTCSTTVNISSVQTNQNGSNNQNQIIPDYTKEIKESQPLNPIPDDGSGNGGGKRVTPYVSLFLMALLFTIVIETLVLLVLLRLAWKKQGAEIKIGSIIFTGIIASAVTIPYLWFILPDILGGGILYIVVGEICVALVESVIIAFILKLKWPFALLLSVICNLASFLLGLLIMSVLI